VLRRVIAEIDPNVALATPQTMDELLTQSIGVQRVTLALLLTFAGIAALLAAVGVYSVMAYSVAQRTSEIGVRLALGAGQAQVVNLILTQGMRLVAIGLGLGLVASAGASRLLTSLLYEIKPLDPLVYGTVTVFFTLVAVLACLLPSLRAARIDPIVALRTE
jgi:ABC-type antimicrobial peptide transport system permease subunit